MSVVKSGDRSSVVRQGNVRSICVFILLMSLGYLLSGCSVDAVRPNCSHAHGECIVVIRNPWKVIASTDEWQDANDSRRMLARIQSNLDRASAGQPTWLAPKGALPDARLRIVDAYADFLRGDFARMDASIGQVEQAAAKFRPQFPGQHPHNWEKENVVFYAHFVAATQSPSPLIRMYAALRVVNGSLVLGYGDPFDGTWLRFPCRTVVGRVTQFVAAATQLKALGGPVLDCPVDGAIDYAKDEVLVLHPEHLAPHVVPGAAPAPSFAPPPPKPGSRADVIAEMATKPDRTAPILAHYSTMDGLGELDYLLFLQTFEPETPARDTTIRALQAKLYKQSMASPGAVHDFPMTPYDGTDGSLLNIIRLASETGVATSGYSIPCAILFARPDLLAATDGYYGGNRDNFMPRSGCQGVSINGFPDHAVNAFETESTHAEGNFLDGGGTIIYALGAYKNATNAKMRLNPRYFLTVNPRTFGYPPADFEYPYEVWGYTSLNNYVESQRLRKLYVAALDQVSVYYEKHMKLGVSKSQESARVALFLATFGGNCGGSIPAVSLRKMLLEQAPLAAIKRALRHRPVGAIHDVPTTEQFSDLLHAALNDGPSLAQQMYGRSADAPELLACARYAGLDPLLLVAVSDPDAFATVLHHEGNVNVRNAIGKTPLMEAAQFNQLNITSTLLAHHAWVNATTWANYTDYSQAQLGDDARTALMYAAANGSLKLVRALLQAGADPLQADTKGYRAIDYLLGYGPTPPNAHLNKQQRAKAARWLF